MEVLLVDDHPLQTEILAAKVRKALGEDATVHVAQDLAGGLDRASRSRELDLVLLDLGLPGFSGIEALKRFREKHPDMRVVVVSANDEAESIQAALRAGAAGYIPKTSTSEVLVAALKVVIAGGTYIPPEALQEDPGASPELSERQQEVLGLMLKGHSNAEIARQLRMAENTVKHHVTAIYGLLDVATRAEAITTALRLGFKPSR